MMAAAWLAAGYVLMSFVEWYLHRHHMHRRGWLNYVQPWLFFNHQAVHHPVYRKNFALASRPEDGEVGVFMPLLKIAAVAAVAFAPVYLWVSELGAACLWLVPVAHAVLWNVIHAQMHRVRDWGLDGWRPYEFLKRYHHLHHVYPNKNFNVVCLGADWVMGTLAPHPAFPAQRPEVAGE